MKSFTCIAIVFIVIWPLAISAQSTYRDEIMEHAIKECYAIVVRDFKLADHLNMSEQEAAMFFVDKIPKDEISKIMKSVLLDVLNQNTRVRFDAYNRYAIKCANNMKQIIAERVSKQ